MNSFLDYKNSVLFLGAGFSKAFSDEMPLMAELSKMLKESNDIVSPEIIQSFGDDIELLLTHLIQDSPWKQPEEAFEDQAKFIRISKWLCEIISGCEDKAFKNASKPWAEILVKYLHENKIPVITLNYDTILERLSYKYIKIDDNHGLPSFELYQMPIANIISRSRALLSSRKIDSFHLVKLHGSINWFSSGSNIYDGEQLYFRPVDSLSPLIDHEKNKDFFLRESSDKYPFIIPPVSEKSSFYRNLTIKSLWRDAKRYLFNAGILFFVGYSLPETDLTIRLLFKNISSGEKKVIYLVNSESNKEKMNKLEDSFKSNFLGSEINKTFFGKKNAVEE
ncbi:MAG TPA: SIR2 family protein, partial [Candidatus Nanoarchaeia archaeon]|nr:SIR2 family protein [Candidatus Nanoarchaeia archaeon]